MRTHYSPLLTHILPFLSPDATPPDGGMLAHILVAIADCEVREGGPYRSVPDRNARKLDLGVNIAVALFLRLFDVHLPKLDAYIKAKLSEVESEASAFFEPAELQLLIDQYRSPNAVADATTPTATIAWTDEELALITKVRTRLDWRLIGLSSEFKRDARHIVERTIMGNPDKQMSLMPLFMRQALGKRGRSFDDYQLSELSLANIFFWTAFIVYDDFWDEDEAAEPKYLPVANLFARHYSGFFSMRLHASRFDRFFHSLMDQLDAANGWELNECRMRREVNILHIPDELPWYDDFDIKFYPAAGHVLGPVSMLFELGYAEHSAEVEGLMAYFKHYLIAMQLNDDAHDWKEDLERGHISTAISLLLEAWLEKHPERRKIHLKKDMRELEHLFWFEVLPKLSESIVERTEKAQRALDGIECIEDPAPLQQFIDRNREAAELALAEQRRSIAFLDVMETAGIPQK